MITEKDYLEACNIIKEYHNQIELLINKEINYDNKKTTIHQFMENYKLSNDNMSKRLYNIFYSLINEPHLSININKKFIDKYKYIEDIDKKLFLRIRNAGWKSWIEFNEVTKNYR